ncbi:MAG: hypothetical protein KJ686_07865, partial [Actinobacteria bacterium]|nr:hypothetical protein [Actinomycetota bacterium]
PHYPPAPGGSQAVVEKRASGARHHRRVPMPAGCRRYKGDFSHSLSLVPVTSASLCNSPVQRSYIIGGTAVGHFTGS